LNFGNDKTIFTRTPNIKKEGQKQ